MSYDQADGHMHIYHCDGMPSLRGCGAEIRIGRPYTKAGSRPKKSGWLVVYAIDENGKQDKSTLLHFCPSCALEVQRQERERGKR